ncbi:MAG: FAD-binding protein [Deinococcus-Thermus bacterium]|jgi:D-lactate dehydrogenase (cytochrome)|nr:FAD-binding protein [Deinococcota bacterium]
MTMQQAISALGDALGPRLVTGRADLEAHGGSESHFPLTPPDAVVYPESTAEVAEIVRACGAAGVPVIGWGVGTSLEGHALATQGGVAMDFSRMAQVLRIGPEDMDCTVQPGLTRTGLNEALKATGLMFPVDPGADATLGGMAACRASGTTAVRYGTMREQVLGLEVVLASGEVIRTGSRARKSASGYDLTGLFVGSEGTLGLITELTLRLHGQPEAISTATCAFPSDAAAIDTVIAAIQYGLGPARIEYMDAESVAAVTARDGLGLPEAPHLLVEFHGTEAGVAEETARFGEIAAEGGAEGFRWSSVAEERNALWRMRHGAYWAIVASRPGCRAIVTDLCVPISRLAEAIAETRAEIAESGLPGPLVGHVGDGNVHAALLIDPDDPAERETAKRLADRMAERALRLGGTVTGEHGVGIGKLGQMQAEHGGAWAVMGAVKQALDPQGILNPGKVVPPRPGP